MKAREFSVGGRGFPSRSCRDDGRHDIDLARRERTVNQAGFADPARGAAPLEEIEGMPPTIFPLEGRRVFVAGHRGMVAQR